MQILEAYDLCRTYRGAADLVGCSHHTVERYAALRDLGQDPEARKRRDQMVDPYLVKVEEWVERSHGKVRADVCHDKLEAMGYGGSERTTRRAVAEVKEAYRKGKRRVYRPWVPEPGMWFQWDWAQGPKAGGRGTELFCTWLAWSRYRVVLPVWDSTYPTLVSCLDATLRAFGGVPTYGLTDNEKTVTVEHVAGVPVRNPDMLMAARHYGFTVATCVPADPETKGGSEATVRLAKADLVPTDANLLEAYGSFGELEVACREFCEAVNGRPHRVTRRLPREMLAEEQRYLHRLPDAPHTLALGQTRKVGSDGLISWGSVPYSVPTEFVEETVWCRVHGEELVVIAMAGGSPREVARHPLSTPGNPRIDPAHYPPRPNGLPERPPRPHSSEEAAFLAIGTGAYRWLVVAAAQGATRVRRKMAEAVALAKLYGREAVDEALGGAAEAGRFGESDLTSVLEHQRQGRDGAVDRQDLSVSREGWSLQPGTAAWKGFGQ